MTKDARLRQERIERKAEHFERRAADAAKNIKIFRESAGGYWHKTRKHYLEHAARLRSGVYNAS